MANYEASPEGGVREAGSEQLNPAPATEEVKTDAETTETTATAEPNDAANETEESSDKEESTEGEGSEEWQSAGKASGQPRHRIKRWEPI